MRKDVRGKESDNLSRAEPGISKPGEDAIDSVEGLGNEQVR